MYKLVIGNVKVTVLEDNIKREQAVAAARETISHASQQGKLLSHIEVSCDENGIKTKFTEKAGMRLVRKTIKHSMLDGILAAAQEKFYPANSYGSQDVWFDSDTGQEWRGSEVAITRTEILEKLEEWIKTV